MSSVCHGCQKFVFQAGWFISQIRDCCIQDFFFTSLQRTKLEMQSGSMSMLIRSTKRFFCVITIVTDEVSIPEDNFSLITCITPNIAYTCTVSTTIPLILFVSRYHHILLHEVACSNNKLLLTKHQTWCQCLSQHKKPVTTMLTYPWKCTVLHCNHLGNTWKPLVLMT